MTLKYKPHGFWNEKNIVLELGSVIKGLGHFPIQDELIKINRGDLVSAITKHGGLNAFREIMGYKVLKKSAGHWSEENILVELETVIKELNHFPTENELINMNKGNLSRGITKRSGFPYFRKKMGYKLLRKSWNEENVLVELETVIKELGHFPTMNELKKMNKYSLSSAITKHGGFLYFRKKMGHKSIQKLPGYWTEETILNELMPIIRELGHFPSRSELINMKKQALSTAIAQHGGMPHFWRILKVTPTEIQKKQSVMASYINKRGFNSEKIVKELITKWCYAHNLPQPDFNVKLSKGNVIEFVCESESRIGIDVTNTKNRSSAFTTISRKWKHKEYHLYLDELWIVVFSDIFTDSDYIKFNKKSPNNVKTMSIETFMEELNIMIDDNLQLKIDNYNTCTFHNKDDFSHPKLGLSKFFKMKSDIRIKI